MEWVELGKVCDVKSGQGAPQNQTIIMKMEFLLLELEI